MLRTIVLVLFVALQPLVAGANESPISTAASSAVTLAVDLNSSDACGVWYFAPAESRIGCLTTGNEFQIDTEVTAEPSAFIIDQTGRILFGNIKQHRIEWIAPNDHDWGALELEAPPLSLTLGPLGKIWFATEQRIGNIDSNDHVSYLSARTITPPVAIASKLGGSNLWIIEESPGTIGRLDSEGNLKEFSIARCPPSTPGYSRWLEPPSAISDGNQLWLVRRCGDLPSSVIVKIASDGRESDTPLSSFGNHAVGLALYHDDLWFAEFEASRIGRLDGSGHITEYPTPSTNARPTAIVLDDKGRLWVIESRLHKLAQLSVRNLGQNAKVIR